MRMVNFIAMIDPQGYKAWYKNGKLHRLDRPAIVYPDGRKEWCKNGKQYYVEEYKTNETTFLEENKSMYTEL